MSRLKQLRKSHGITQDELGEILGVQKAAVCKYETGRVPLPHEAIVKLCDHFHVTADYLLGIDGPEAAQLLASSSGPFGQKRLKSRVSALGFSAVLATGCSQRCSPRGQRP